MSCSLHTGFLLSIILSCSHIPGFAQFIDDKQKKRVTGRINYERIDARKTFAYYLDLYGHNYETDLFLQDYLKNFDDQYSKYKENEFELKRNQLKAKEEIEAGLREVDFTKVFVEYYGTSFGDYDFDRNMFAFKPFKSGSYIRYDDNVFRYRVPNERRWSGYNSESFQLELYILNYEDFEGLALEPDRAEALLKLRTNESVWGPSIDHTVYLKAYFSVLNKKLSMKKSSYANEYSNALQCYVYKIEVWEDKEMMTYMLAEMHAKSAPPEYLRGVKDQVLAAHQKKDFRSIFDEFHPGDAWLEIGKGVHNYERFGRSTMSDYKVHLSLVKSNDPNRPPYNFKVSILTNGCFEMGISYRYTFIDNFNREFPLAITSLSLGDYDFEPRPAIGSIPATKETLQVLQTTKITKLRMEVNKMMPDNRINENCIPVGWSNSITLSFDQNISNQITRMITDMLTK